MKERLGQEVSLRTAVCRSILDRRGPADHFDAEIAPALPEHVAPVFESLCRRWVRRNLGARATLVGPWWGRALDRLRAAGERGSEEIDLVGAARSRVTVVGTSSREGSRRLEFTRRFDHLFVILNG